MAFFPSYKDRFTRTPNIFFDVILRDPKVTINQARLVGYLIRRTIGYNKEAKWVAVSRSDLIKYAGIPNGRIKDAITGCEEKGWILTFEQGQNGKQERYIFLNDPLNVCIVQGLKKGCFAVTDLEYLNLAGINKLLEKHGLLQTPTETGEEQQFSSTEMGGVPPTETGGVPPTETGGGNEAGNQVAQRVAQPLNTSSKDNKKDNNVKAVVVSQYQEEFKKLFNEELDEQDAKSFALEAANNGKDLIDYIHYVKSQSEKRKIENPVGYLRDAVYGNWNVPSVAELEQAAAREAEEREARKKENDDRVIQTLIAAGINPAEVGY